MSYQSLSRRKFLFSLLVISIPFEVSKKRLVMTVNGPVDAGRLGVSLVHEHVLVDFIGADKISFSRWNKDEVINKVLPYLLEVRKQGVKTFYDCTPAFLGRDVRLLQRLSNESGLNIVTNTGYYGAVKNKYLPASTATDTAEELAERWVDEFEKGIEDTGMRPGFIKIGVDSDGPLSDLHKKLVEAAAITHLRTGLTIFSHTGASSAAFEQLQVLSNMGVNAAAFVWVHAQNEKNISHLVDAASRGCWVSLDGIGWGETTDYVHTLVKLKTAGLLHRVLISHDAGWYKPEAPQADFNGYTKIFRELLPALRLQGFSRQNIQQLLVKNPAEAMHIRLRRKERFT